jgi:hypothetical protein
MHHVTVDVTVIEGTNSSSLNAYSTHILIVQVYTVHCDVSYACGGAAGALCDHVSDVSVRECLFYLHIKEVL